MPLPWGRGGLAGAPPCAARRVPLAGGRVPSDRERAPCEGTSEGRRQTGKRRRASAAVAAHGGEGRCRIRTRYGRTPPPPLVRRPSRWGRSSPSVLRRCCSRAAAAHGGERASPPSLARHRRSVVAGRGSREWRENMRVRVRVYPSHIFSGAEAIQTVHQIGWLRSPPRRAASIAGPHHWWAAHAWWAEGRPAGPTQQNQRRTWRTQTRLYLWGEIVNGLKIVHGEIGIFI